MASRTPISCSATSRHRRLVNRREALKLQRWTDDVDVREFSFTFENLAHVSPLLFAFVFLVEVIVLFNVIARCTWTVPSSARIASLRFLIRIVLRTVVLQGRLSCGRLLTLLHLRLLEGEKNSAPVGNALLIGDEVRTEIGRAHV